MFTMIAFCVNAQTESTMMINSHVKKLEDAKEYTIAVARLMPENLYNFKPVPEEMSFGEQLIHLSQNLYWLSSTYIGEVPNPYQATKDELAKLTKDSIISLINNAYDYAINSISKMDIKSLAKEFNFSGKKLNKYQFLNLIEDHQTHHRAQAIVYLRLNRIKPPGYIGW